MKHLILSAALVIMTSVAAAQDTTTATGNTTSTAQRATTASQAMSRNFTQEAFEKRWEMEKSMYKEAGISADKIEKLREINLTLWKSRASGEKVDFQALSRQRSEILSKEDMEKVMKVRRNKVNERMNPTDASTTPSQQ